MALEIVDNSEGKTEGDPTQNILQNGRGKKIWGYNETLQFIETMGSYYSEITNPNPRIKKKAWQNIANVLTSFKIEATVDEIKKKWSNLIQTYNKTKDLKTRTGRGATRFLFFKSIDDIVGNKPTSSCSFSMDLGSATQTSMQSSQAKSPTTTGNDEEERASCSANQVQKPSRKRRNYTLEYFKAKKEFLQIKEREIEKRALQREEEKSKKEEVTRERTEMNKKKLKLEERKVEALEAYVRLQKEKKTD